MEKQGHQQCLTSPGDDRNLVQSAPLQQFPLEASQEHKTHSENSLFSAKLRSDIQVFLPFFLQSSMNKGIWWADPWEGRPRGKEAQESWPHIRENRKGSRRLAGLDSNLVSELKPNKESSRSGHLGKSVRVRHGHAGRK